MVHHKILISDLSGLEAVETLHFALDRTSYFIDLTQDEARRFRRALGPVIQMARADSTASAPVPCAGRATRHRPSPGRA